MKNWRVRGVKGTDSIEDVITAKSITDATNIFHARHPGYTVFSVHPLD